MKKVIIFILLVTTSVLIWSMEESIIRTSVNNYIEIQNLALEIDEINEISYHNEQVGTIVNLKPSGFLIFSDDTNLSPLIAYSFENNMEINSKFYELVSYDLHTREQNLHLLRNDGILRNNQLWNEAIDGNFHQISLTRETPIIDTRWDQNYPYNMYCPQAPGESRAIAGCPSIAIAQILAHYKTIHNTTFGNEDSYTHSYVHNYNIDGDHDEYGFPSFSELNNLLDTLKLHFANGTDLTNSDKGALVFASGVAARQVYNPGGSGTFGVSQAFDAYQKFGFDSATLMTDEENLFEVVIDNIENGYPVHYAVVTPAWDSGHNVVIDGYNDEGFFHINFGWGGPSDGWYLIPQEFPYNLTVTEGAVVNIIPKSPSSPTNPTPANDAIITVDDLENFSFDICDSTNIYLFYLGDSAENQELILAGSPSEIPVSLSHYEFVSNTEYFWRVSAQNDFGNVSSELWSFTYQAPISNEINAFSDLNCISYPNPIKLSDSNRSITTIEFTQTEDSHVNLDIFNVKGQKIKSLLNTRVRQGVHKVEWNGSNENGSPVSAGIYFFRLRNCTLSKTGKMILLK
jgi:hypothetical protein